MSFLGERLMSTRRAGLVALGYVLAVVGCGLTAPDPAATVDQEVRDYVTQRYAGNLVTDGLLGNGPKIPMPVFQSPPDYSRMFPEPVDNTPGGRYLRDLEAQGRITAAEARFANGPSVPEVRGSLDDCRVPAKLVDFKVVRKKKQPGSGDMYEVEFRATQELEVDLYELIDDRKAMALVGGNDLGFSLAVDRARKLPANLDLHQKWLELRKTRGWALKQVHKKGSKWVTTGKLWAEFVGLQWSFQMPTVNLQNKPQSRAVTIDRCPKGLLTIDPDNPKSVEAEWQKPFEAFTAEVAARDLELHTNKKRQPELLRNYLAPGTVWRTRITASEGSMDIELTFERVSDEGRYHGTFVARNGDRETKVEVFGKINELSKYYLEETKSTPDKVPFGLHGMGATMMTSEHPKRSKLWNELRFVVAANPKEDAPTLIWLDQIKKLEPVK